MIFTLWVCPVLFYESCSLIGNRSSRRPSAFPQNIPVVFFVSPEDSCFSSFNNGSVLVSHAVS